MMWRIDDDEDAGDEEASEAEVTSETPASVFKAARKTDRRMDALKQTSFINKPKTLEEILEVEYSSKLSRDTGLGSGHGLGGGSALKSDKVDPLKAITDKTVQHAGKGDLKKAATYSEHVDKMSDIYGQYLGVDASARLKKSMKR